MSSLRWLRAPILAPECSPAGAPSYRVLDKTGASEGSAADKPARFTMPTLARRESFGAERRSLAVALTVVPRKRSSILKEVTSCDTSRLPLPRPFRLAAIALVVALATFGRVAPAARCGRSGFRSRAVLGRSLVRRSDDRCPAQGRRSRRLPRSGLGAGRSRARSAGEGAQDARCSPPPVRTEALGAQQDAAAAAAVSAVSPYAYLRFFIVAGSGDWSYNGYRGTLYFTYGIYNATVDAYKWFTVSWPAHLGQQPSLRPGHPQRGSSP